MAFSSIINLALLFQNNTTVERVSQADGARGAAQQLWSWLNTPFAVGSFEIKVANVALGLGVLLLAVFASRSMRSFVQRRIARRMPFDPGLQYTLLRLTHYFIISLGILYSIKIALGVDLTAFAVVFTALSVGIGFGLQFIAADIASGFILLFERPVRVGDRITLGDTEGKVESINLRTTVLVTNDQTAIILPNSKLVNGSFTNWTYGEPQTRIAVPVSVAATSDTDLVQRTVLRAVEGVESVLGEPKPDVQLLRFNDCSLDFQLLVWTLAPHAQLQIKSDINYRIMRLFKEAKIEFSSTPGRAPEAGKPQLPTKNDNDRFRDDETIVPDRREPREALAPSPSMRDGA